MSALDALKSMRSSGYSGASDGKPEEENPTSRTIKLTEDEMKGLEGQPPGGDVVLEVHGSVEADGRFRVMSVAPSGGQPKPEGADMAQQLAQRIAPTMQPSPS